jgi:hypothetical protein
MSVIQLTKNGFTCPADLDALAHQFTQQHTIRLPQLLHGDLMRTILGNIEQGAWRPYDHGEIGRELLLEGSGALQALRFVAQTPEFLKTVECITQCRPISVFDGRVYRMVPGTDNYDSWHNDVHGTRLVGMSINLGSDPHSGGVFQLRKKGEKAILCEVPNVVQGDAILFRISNELNHRITPMEGTEPKTAFAGWFESGASNFFSELRHSAHQASARP